MNRNPKYMLKKSALLTLCLLSSQAFASSGIYLDGSVEFSGRCADLTVEGMAFDSFSMPVKSMGFSVSLNEKTVFDDGTVSSTPVFVFEHMAMRCVLHQGDPKLIIAGSCAANATVCGKPWFYVLDAKTGQILAPKDLKKDLCDAKCAEKVGLGGMAEYVAEDYFD